MASWGSLSTRDDGAGRPPRRALRSGEREHEFPIRPEWAVDIPRSVEMLPGVVAVMTSAFESKRGGVLVHRIMKCADEPVCVAVAVPKGQRLATLIRDSHGFALSILERTTKLMLRKFAPDEEGDPFDTFELTSLATGSPILRCAVAALDCEVMRHFDLDADHELYVGQVIASKIYQSQRPIAVPGVEVPAMVFEDARPGEEREERGRDSRPLRLGDGAGGRRKRTEGGRMGIGAPLDQSIPASPK